MKEKGDKNMKLRLLWSRTYFVICNISNGTHIGDYRKDAGMFDNRQNELKKLSFLNTLQLNKTSWYLHSDMWNQFLIHSFLIFCIVHTAIITEYKNRYNDRKNGIDNDNNIYHSILQSPQQEKTNGKWKTNWG